MEREWKREQLTKHQLKKIFADCPQCCPRLQPGFKRLDRDAIIAKTNILDLLTSYGHTPRKAGARYVALCLWHNEKNPSMVVYPESGRVWCPVCSNFDTSIGIVAHMEGLTFVEAMRYLDRAS
jgi:DNA primase